MLTRNRGLGGDLAPRLLLKDYVDIIPMYSAIFIRSTKRRIFFEVATLEQHHAHFPPVLAR